MKGKPLTVTPDRGQRVGVLDDDNNITRWSNVREVLMGDREVEVLLADGTVIPLWQLSLL